MATLADIRALVRDLTRSQSPEQLTDAKIDESIDNFMLYDFSNRVRPLDLRRTLTFYTIPNVDTYDTNTVDVSSPLYNFKNKYVNVMNPFYVAGFPAVLSQDREPFWGMYPIQQYINFLPTLGNGVQVNYVGTMTYFPVLQNTITFASTYIDGGGNQVPLILRDYPNTLNGNMATTGIFIIPDQIPPAVPILIPKGTINYVTGAYNLTFDFPPQAQAKITTEYISYTAGRPYNILFFNSTFTLRPIPDNTYPVTFDVTIRPTAFLNNPLARPDIDEWWEYIAYGCARKILQRRLDKDTEALIMDEFLNQEALVMRKTLVQNTSKRSITIYNQPSNFRYGYGWPSDWNFFGLAICASLSYIILGVNYAI